MKKWLSLGMFYFSPGLCGVAFFHQTVLLHGAGASGRAKTAFQTAVPAAPPGRYGRRILGDPQTSFRGGCQFHPPGGVLLHVFFFTPDHCRTQWQLASAALIGGAGDWAAAGAQPFRQGTKTAPHPLKVRPTPGSIESRLREKNAQGRPNPPPASGVVLVCRGPQAFLARTKKTAGALASVGDHCARRAKKKKRPAQNNAGGPGAEGELCRRSSAG